MKTDVRNTKAGRLVLSFMAAFSLSLVSSVRGYAQEETSPTEVRTSAEPITVESLAIEENPIYERLIEIVNFLSVGVTIVIAISVAIAGIQYMASRGDPSGTQAAIQRIIQAGTALVLYIFGWSLLNWLVPGGVL